MNTNDAATSTKIVITGICDTQAVGARTIIKLTLVPAKWQGEEDKVIIEQDKWVQL